MLAILSAPKRVVQKNLKALADDYKEKTGRVVCLSCPSDIQFMISSLKQFYKMVNFEFKKNAAQYKNAKGDKTTISNNTMTDEKAIEFLKTNPERIRLFSKFPENWKELIEGEQLTEEELQAKAAEQAAELEAANALKNANADGTGEDLSQGGKIEGQVDLIDSIEEQGKINEIEVNEPENLSPEEEAIKASEQAAEQAANVALNNEEKKEDCCDDDHDGEPCEECKEKKRAELMKMKLADLRKAYPEVKATSIKTFVEQVLNQ
jgi:hypothetical protein